MFTLKIKTDGSAFCDPFFDGHEFFKQREVARILRELADKLDWNAEFGRCLESSVLRDLNGNIVGEFRMK